MNPYPRCTCENIYEMVMLNGVAPVYLLETRLLIPPPPPPMNIKTDLKNQKTSKSNKRDATKKKKKKTPSKRGPYQAVVEQMGADLAEAMGEIDSLKELLREERSLASELVDLECAVNSWSLSGQYNTKQFRYSFGHHDQEGEPQTVWISGTFRLGDRSVFIDRQLPIYRGVGRVVASSKCGTIVFHDPTEECKEVRPDWLELKDNRDLVISSAYSTLYSLDYRSKGDRAKIFRAVKAHYKRFHKEFQQLDEVIMEVINSDEFEAAYSRHLDKVGEIAIKRLENKARCVAVHNCSTYESEYAAARKRLVRSGMYHRWLVLFGLMTTLPVSAVFGEVAGLTWLLVPALMIVVNLAAGCRYFAFKHSEEEVMRNICQRFDHPVPQFNFVPAAKVYLETQTFDQERMPEAKTGVLSTDYDPDLWEESKVEIFGSTIPGPKVYPSQAPANMEAAFRIRMMQYEGPDDGAWREFWQYSLMLLEDLPDIMLEQFDNLKFLTSQYGAKKGRRLFELSNHDFEDRDARCSAFVKKEVYMGKNPDDFKPRMIWNRSEKIVAKFSGYFHQMGKKLKTALGERNILYATSVTPDEIGAFVEQMFSYPHVSESDVSNWDGSLGRFMLALELWFLQNKVEGLPDEVDFLFTHWFDMKAQTRTGDVRVELNHGRRSGDLWTSSLNSLLNVLIVMWVYNLRWTDDFSMIVLGDDNGVATKKKQDADLAAERYKLLGMKCEVISRDHIEDFTFCSGLIWNVGGKYRWGNLPFRTLAKFGVNHNKHPEKFHKQLLYGTAKGMLCTAGHIPVVGALLRAIIDDGERRKLKARVDNSRENPYRPQGGVTIYPTIETYVQFSARYGIPLDVILDLEEYITCTITLDSFPVELTDGIFVRGYQQDCGKPIKDKCHVLEDIKMEQIPELEEAEKLSGARNFWQALDNAYQFGLEEAAITPLASHHPILHMFFTALSWVCFDLGVKAHSLYNHFAMTQGFPSATNKNRRRRRRKRRQQTSKIHSYAKMVADPCDATLVPGLFSTDEGWMAGRKTRFGSGTGNAYGYVLWCPKYVSNTGLSKSAAIFFTSVASSTQPLNTTANPFGSAAGTGDPEGYTIDCGASAFVTSAVVADYRTVGACMRVTYTGAMQSAAGLVGYLENIPTHSLIDDLPSVDDMMAYAHDVQRLGVDTFEVVWRPDQMDDIFKVESDAPITIGSGALSVTSSESKRFNPMWSGFVFHSVTAMSDLSIEFYQNVEWRPNIDQGYVPRHPSTINEPGYFQRVVQYLDENYPDWTRKIISSAVGGASQVARMALTGRLPSKLTLTL